MYTACSYAIGKCIYKNSFLNIYAFNEYIDTFNEYIDKKLFLLDVYDIYIL